MSKDANVDRAIGNVKLNAANAKLRTGVPGIAIAVVCGDRVVVGDLDVGTTVAGGKQVGADTVFQLASMSKPITTTIAAWLVNRKGPAAGDLLAWEDLLADRAPELALSRGEVTLGSLFAHRSGLPDHAGDLLEDVGYSRDEILKRRLTQLPLMPPLPEAERYACEYAYTNFGFTAAAVAMAAAVPGGAPWEDLAADVLYGPLGMRDTSSRYADFKAHLAAGRAAVPHQRTPAPLAGTPLFPDRPVWAPPAYPRRPDAQSPAGGVSSTTRDLAAWMRLQLGIGASGPFDDAFRVQLAATHEPYVTGAKYGLGWNVNPGSKSRPAIWSHSGAFALGTATCVMLLPDHATGIAVLTNGQPVGVPEAICRAFVADLMGSGADFNAVLEDTATAMQDLLYPQPEPVPARNPSHPPRGPADYKGTYRDAYYGPLVVDPGSEASGAGGALELVMGPDGARPLPLEPRDGDTFAYTPPGENGGLPSAVTFVPGAGGRIERLVVRHLFEPYTTGNRFPDEPSELARYVSDVWNNVYTVDTGLRIDVDGVLRKWTFYALNDNPVELVIYRPSGAGYEVRCRGPRQTPRPSAFNKFFTGDLEVRAGDLVGFYRPGQGSIGFVLARNAHWDKGKGNLSGRVLFTEPTIASPTAFTYSSDRTYLIEVEVARGLRGSGAAVRG